MKVMFCLASHYQERNIKRRHHSHSPFVSVFYLFIRVPLQEESLQMKLYLYQGDQNVDVQYYLINLPLLEQKVDLKQNKNKKRR